MAIKLFFSSRRSQRYGGPAAMGRLTLNILLSFAQFEREVISERIRDKIAASKQSEMGWAASRRSATGRGIASLL
jgi:DNA invertase Pin-like site-specific DNA recombinase